jgi:hypothetical protein
MEIEITVKSSSQYCQKKDVVKLKKNVDSRKKGERLLKLVFTVNMQITLSFDLFSFE